MFESFVRFAILYGIGFVIGFVVIRLLMPREG